jgi:hypothetical protein
MLGRKPNGRSDRPKVTGKTRGEVQRQLAEPRCKADLGLSTDVSQGHQTVACLPGRMAGSCWYVDSTTNFERLQADCRHAHATLMLRPGVPLKVASGRLGHGSVAITADLY